MFTMLYDIIVAPIEMIVDWVFLFATNYMSIFGVMGAIVCVSMAINFLTLPIYNVADKIQNEERETQKKLSSGIERIKAVFSGDERFMILQTFYRQNHYSPIYALRSSISVLIQIPFFMAAYHYLSNNELLQEGGFLFVKNLGEPDALFSVGSFAINVLPIFMTLINVVSGIVYTKGFPLREKVQVYGLAAVFLVLLYNSPSGLVLYWIMNNVFSLCKNFVKKTRHPVKVVALGVCILLLAVLAASFALNPTSFGWKKKFLLAFVVVLLVATLFVGKLITILRNKFVALQKSIFGYTPPPVHSDKQNKTDFLLFISSAIGLALLAGFLLPSSVISTSPTEFSFLGQTESPLSYIYSSVCVFAGLFVLWPVVIYKMFSGKVRDVMPPLFFVLFVCALLNAYIFKHNYGNLTATFLLDNPDVLKSDGVFLSLVPFVAAVFVAMVYVLCRRLGTVRFLYGAVFSVCLATAAFSVYKTKYIRDEFASYIKPTFDQKKNNQKNEISSADTIEPVYNLSREKKNVIVFLLDRAISSYVPYIFKQFPQLSDIYSGFKYFPNTLSFGSGTTTGSPSLMGGYEYTPEEINKREKELLMTKHNEAMLLQPKLFLDAGYNVTVTNPELSNYRWSGDFTPFEEYPEISVNELEGKYTHLYVKRLANDMPQVDRTAMKEIKNFCSLQIILPIARHFFYEIYVPNFSQNFITAFTPLFFLRNLTTFNASRDTYTFIVNNTTHEPSFLLPPEYDLPASMKDAENSFGYYKPSDNVDGIHYHANIATLLQISKWLEYLKENECYNNTRIILVSDHGRGLKVERFRDFFDTEMFASYNALLMYKDFDETSDFQTDNTFMTNADTLFLAKKDLPVSNLNPFTGKELIQKKENGIDIYSGGGWHIDLPSRFTETKFNLGSGYHIRDNIFDESNWTPIEYKDAGGNK